MLDRKSLATTALAKALSLRQKLNFELDDAISPIDCAERIGVEVRLLKGSSMEGIYSPGKKATILLSCQRSQGRRNFTCGHELGHHIFAHGEQFDEIVSERSKARIEDPDEFLADCFSGYLLMPKSTVDSGMRKRGFTYPSLTHMEVYALSSWLGIGYETLIHHMFYSLKTIPSSKYEHLLKYKPIKIRESIYAPSANSNLHVVDEHWKGRAIDCEVGDYILLPSAAGVEGLSVTAETHSPSYQIVKADCAGISRVTIEMSGWASFIRVSPREFVGLSQFRHEEEIK